MFAGLSLETAKPVITPNFTHRMPKKFCKCFHFIRLHVFFFFLAKAFRPKQVIYINTDPPIAFVIKGENTGAFII